MPYRVPKAERSTWRMSRSALRRTIDRKLTTSYVGTEGERCKFSCLYDMNGHLTNLGRGNQRERPAATHPASYRGGSGGKKKEWWWAAHSYFLMSRTFSSGVWHARLCQQRTRTRRCRDISIESDVIELSKEGKLDSFKGGKRSF